MLRGFVRKGLQSSGPSWALTHQGAVNSASRKTPPVRRRARRMSITTSMAGFLHHWRRIGQEIRHPAHSPCCQAAEIGREPCRERVCQNVYIQGGAIQLKKQNTDTITQEAL